MPDAPISPDQVRHIAMLCRLAITDEQANKFALQLQTILRYVAKINQVDTTDVEPMAHPLPLRNVFREDVVEPSLSRQQVFQNAPETDGPFFKVPKVIGPDADSAR